MTSLRHNDAREPRDVYLDAARDCILDVGWRRTTLTEVARRSGVSRMTIYRTWSDMPTLLGDLMTREWGGVVDQQVALASGLRTGDEADDGLSDDGLSADGLSAEAGPVDRLVAGIVGAVRLLRRNELFVRILELDPELVLPYLLSRRGRSQDHILELTAEAIRAGQAAGQMRAGDPVAMARAMVLTAHGFVLSVHTMVDDDGSAGRSPDPGDSTIGDSTTGVTEADLDAELTLLLTRGLRP